MALIEVAEYYPHAGLIWARANDLLAEVVVDDTKTFAWGVTVLGTRKELTVDQVYGGDTHRYHLVDLYKLDSERYSFDYVLTLPGMRKVPPVLPKLAGARNVLDYWENFATPMRETWLTAISGWTAQYLAGPDYTASDPATRFKGTVWLIRKDLHFGTDFIIGQAENGSPPDGYVASQPEAQGQPALAPVLTVGSASSGPDITPIVEALNDIALIDVEYTANNGGAVWSMRGKVRTP